MNAVARWEEPRGGYGLWMELLLPLDDVACVEAAGRNGVFIHPGRTSYVAEPPSSFLRVNFAATDGRGMHDASARLARVFASLMGKRKLARHGG
jgi:DNA-binding transcriptional MocR family regulator